MASSKSPDRAEDPIARSALGKDRTGISGLKAKPHCGAGPSAMDLAVEFPHRASFDVRVAGTPFLGSQCNGASSLGKESSIHRAVFGRITTVAKLAERHIWVVHIAY